MRGGRGGAPRGQEESVAFREEEAEEAAGRQQQDLEGLRGRCPKGSRVSTTGTGRDRGP